MQPTGTECILCARGMAASSRVGTFGGHRDLVIDMASRVQISKRLLLINSASSIGAQVLHASVLFWLNAYLLRRISADEYSLYPLVLAIVGFIPLFTVILSAGLGRYLMEAYAQGNDDRVREIVSSMVPLLTVAGLVLALLGGLVAWYIDWILVIPEGCIWDARLMLFLLVFMTAISLPLGPIGQGLWIRQKFVMINIIQVCAETLKSAILVILLLWVSPRVLWVVVATVAAQFAALVINTIVSLRALPTLWFRWQGIRWDLVRTLTSFGGWNFLIALAGRTREYAIPLILNHMGTPNDIASFQVGTMGRRQIDHWFDVAARPVYPIVTGMYAMGAKERFQNAFLRGGRIALWVILSAALPAMIYAEEIIDLYIGPTYAQAGVVLVVSLACYLMSPGIWMTWTMAAAKAQLRPLGIRISAAQFSGVLLTVVMTGWLGLGAMGAALAAFIASSFSLVFFSLPIGLRLAEVRLETWIRRTLVPGLAPGCTAAVVWMSLHVFATPDSWLEIGWCVLAGGLCYLAVLLAFCLEPKDRADLLEILRRIRNPFVRPPTPPEQPPVVVPAEPAVSLRQDL